MGFASILKDGTGKPSGYRMRVYRRGVLLRGISPEGFHCFNPAYIGNHQVIYTPYGDAKVAHPETFEVLDDGLGKFGPEGYGRDAEFVYFFTCSTDTCYAVRLRGCKNPSAVSLLPSGYAKDDAHVYYSQAIVKQALPDSFAVLKDGYARDDRHVFWRNQLLKTNVRDFTILGDGYAKDGRQYFPTACPAGQSRPSLDKRRNSPRLEALPRIREKPRSRIPRPGPYPKMRAKL